ncbi:MAG: endonuclease [Catenulispora sp.]|nr:endonuclease [Catenulispora sp.]
MADTFRILSYNVRSLRDDRAALARVVRGCRPDLLCVQESPRFFGWRRAARAMAVEFGLDMVVGGADASGNLLLAGKRVDVGAKETVFLRHRRGLHLRGMALAAVTIGGRRFTVASTHLSLDDGQRRDQAEEVLERLDGFAEREQAPSQVLCGDFNSHPDSAEWGTLTSRLVDAWQAAPEGEEFTSTARDPYQRLDAVFVSRDVTVLRAGVPTDLVAQADLAVASDHRPVLAVLAL